MVEVGVVKEVAEGGTGCGRGCHRARYRGRGKCKADSSNNDVDLQWTD